MRISVHFFLNILLLLPAILVGAVAMDIYVPVVTSMPEALNTTTVQVQLTLSCFMFAYGLGQILYGPLCDRFGRRTLALYSIGMYVIASLGCACANSIEQLIIARTFAGLAACGGIVAVIAMVRDRYQGDLQSRAYSYLHGVVSVAPIIAPLLGSYLFITYNTWRAPFYFLAIMGAVIWILYALRLPETLTTEKQLPLSRQSFIRYWNILQNWRFLRFTWAAVASMGSLFLFFSISPLLYMNLFGVSAKQFSVLFALNAASIMIANFVCPEIQKRIGNQRIIQIGCLLITLGGCIIFTCYLTGLINVISLLVAMQVASFGFGLIGGPATAEVLAEFAQMAGTATALQGCLRFMIPALIGWFILLWPVTNVLPLVYGLLFYGLTGFCATLSSKSTSEKIMS